MSIDISRVARAFCDLTIGSKTPLKLSHAQQCVAAAFGFKSLAAWQAAKRLETPVKDNSFFVFISNDLLTARAQVLVPSADGVELASTLRQAILGLYPQASIHASWPLRRVSIAYAIAGLVGLDPILADDLDDARVEVIENKHGEVQGFRFNFDEPDWQGWAAHIRQRHGSLSVYAPASFLQILKGCEAPTRFYVHGDQHEREPLKYYCQACDYFEPADHFSSAGHEDNCHRYFSHLGVWDRAVARWKLPKRRPRSAVNLLAAQAIEERRAAEAARSGFHRWIEQQVGRDDAVGSIAKDILRDDTFPKTAQTRDAVVGYVAAVATWEEPVEAVKIAWAEFSSINQTSITAVAPSIPTESFLGETLRVAKPHDVSPDPYPELLIERGPHGRGVGRWVVEEKHRYLARYLNATREAQKKFKQRVLIDPFCGPGRIQVEGEGFTREGGSVAAYLQAAQSGAPFTKLLVGDIEGERASANELRLKAVGANVQSFVGPANETVDQMVKAVPFGALALAYIDPYNLEFLSFSIIERLAKLQHVDFAVHFSLMDLTRNIDMELDPARDRFDHALPGWRSAAPTDELSKSSLPGWFFNAWCKAIGGLGFKISGQMPLITDGKGRSIYRLVFFSRHSLPDRIWSDIARGGNLELFPN
jgi:three-Cys-motif partner protein